MDKRKVPGVYRKIAPYYDVWARLTESRARTRCLDLAAIRNGESVLEVAVGTGLAFEQILRLNPDGRNEGIDLTEEMLERARSKARKTGAGNYNLAVGDAYQLNVADNRFDVLINNYMFDLLPESDFPTVLTEFNRVLRPGGRMVLANMAQGSGWSSRLWTLAYRVKPSLVGGCRGVDLLPYVQAVRFRDIKRETLTQFTIPSEIVFATKA